MIAILGATGTIGQSLARELASIWEPLSLFARQPDKLAARDWPAHVSLQHLDRFKAADYDLVINAIGVGDPRGVAATGTAILDITQTWDQRVTDTMGPRTRYVFLSSGAVHEPLSTSSGGSNRAASPYVLAKRQAEYRHRATPDRSILDVRIFGYADVAMPLDGTFFLSGLLRGIVERRAFVTSPQDMVRDYAGAAELASLIRCWQDASAPNLALELYSRSPVAKSELLNMARDRYGLIIDCTQSFQASSTANISNYVPRGRDAAALSYIPIRSSAEVVVDVIDGLIATRSRLAP